MTTRYMIYFEPEEMDANNLEDAEYKWISSMQSPKILKIVPAEFVYDIDQEKKIT